MAGLLALGIALGGLALLVLIGVCVTSVVCSFFPDDDEAKCPNEATKWRLDNEAIARAHDSQSQIADGKGGRDE